MRKIALLLFMVFMLQLVSCTSGSKVGITGKGIIHEPEFGGIYIKMTIDEFNAVGFEYGDSVDVSFSNGYEIKDIPYYNGYYVDPGDVLLVAYPGYPYIKITCNYGDDFFVTAGVGENDTADVTLNERAKYLDTQKARDIHYKDDRALYPNDTVFANFRSCDTGNLGHGRLFRSASPCDNQHSRAGYVDKLSESAGIKYILDLADNKEKVESYMSAEDFDSPYFKRLYDDGCVGLLALSANYSSDDFRSSLGQGLIDMLNHEGPYLVHCTEGKDRTGFVVMLLEALTGATYEEIVEDYMITYFNYYGIARFNDEDRYQLIKNKNIDKMIEFLTGTVTDDYNSLDLTHYAEEYLSKAGLTAQQIEQLKLVLTK